MTERYDGINYWASFHNWWPWPMSLWRRAFHLCQVGGGFDIVRESETTFKLLARGEIESLLVPSSNFTTAFFLSCMLHCDSFPV